MPLTLNTTLTDKAGKHLIARSAGVQHGAGGARALLTAKLNLVFDSMGVAVSMAIRESWGQRPRGALCKTEL